MSFEWGKKFLLRANGCIYYAKLFVGVNNLTNYIEKEIIKIDSLIEILKLDDLEYNVMKLERLYMQLLLYKSEEEFDQLTITEKSDMFIKVFPLNWFAVPIEKIEESIIGCNNV